MAGEILARLEDDRVRAFLAEAAGKSMVFDGSGGGGSDGLGLGGGLIQLFQPGSDYDYARQAGDLWRNSAVAACLRVLRVNFPQPRFRVVRRAGRGKGNEVAEHPLTRLLRRPNPSYGWYELGAAVALSAVVDGNCYLLKIRSGAGIPVELWWVPHWMITPRWSARGTEFIDHYEYRVNGTLWRIAPADIVHFRWGGLDPRNPRVGLSELKAAAARSATSLNEADGFTASVLRNMGIPTVLIAPSGPGAAFTKDQADQVRDQWRESLTGEGRGKPFLPRGPVTVTKLTFTPEELALDRIPARLEDQICSLAGVPAMVAGVTSGAQHKTYANYAEARSAFYDDTLAPLQGAFALCLDQQLLGDIGLGDRDRESCGFDYSEVTGLGEDQDRLWARIGQAYAVHKTIMRSEAREAIGLEVSDEDNVYADEAGLAVAQAVAGMTAPKDGEEPDGDEGKPGKGDEDGDEPGPPKPKGKMAPPFPLSGRIRRRRPEAAAG